MLNWLQKGALLHHLIHLKLVLTEHRNCLNWHSIAEILTVFMLRTLHFNNPKFNNATLEAKLLKNSLYYSWNADYNLFLRFLFVCFLCFRCKTDAILAISSNTKWHAFTRWVYDKKHTNIFILNNYYCNNFWSGWRLKSSHCSVK